jgi:sulfite reductase alpha subunit-like flavoprotein
MQRGMPNFSRTNGTHEPEDSKAGEETEASHHSPPPCHDEDTDAEDDDRRLLILYASQTGGAQDVAEYMGREAWRRHFAARVQDVRDFDKVRLFRPAD